MLQRKPHNQKQIPKLEVDGIRVDFSLAWETTKVSMHVLHTLLGLIT